MSSTRNAALILLIGLCLQGCKRREDAGPTMMPGEDCIGCHIREAGAPQFTAAGTAYLDHQGGAPAVGAAVTITDSRGAQVRLTTNSVGNFFTSQQLIPPVIARIELDGTVREMKTHQPHGSCNHCHRNPPREQAPGRISARPADPAPASTPRSTTP